MPSYFIMSLFERQKQKYWEQICRAREELAQFDQGLDVLVGTEVAAIVRQRIHIPWDRLFKGDKLPEVPPEGQAAVAEVQRLIKQETSFTRHLHSPICCYMEYRTPPGVLYCYGISWDYLQELEKDGRLPLEYVLWLLDIVANNQMRLPTAKELTKRGEQSWDEARTVEEWHRLLERNRRQLIRFLRTAAHLEEDLMRGFL